MKLRTVFLLVLVLLGAGALALETGMTQPGLAGATAPSSGSLFTLRSGERSDDSIEVPVPDTVAGPRSPATEPSCSDVALRPAPDAADTLHAGPGDSPGAPAHYVLEVVLPPSNGPPESLSA